MPLVTLTVRAGKPPAWKAAILAGVHGALVASGVPETDRFQRALELDEASFAFDATYPDLASPRTNEFVLERSGRTGRSAAAGCFTREPALPTRIGG